MCKDNGIIMWMYTSGLYRIFDSNRTE